MNMIKNNFDKKINDTFTLSFREKFLFFCAVTGIYLVAWVIQEKLFLNWDVSMLMNATRKWLSGGNYINDFFTPNPPMILYLYTPPIILSKLFHTDSIYTFRIYIFLLISFSFFTCYFLSQKIFFNQNKFLACVFLSTLLTVFFILPFYQFGQRDHLLAIMTAPYLLLVVYRLQGNAINPFYAFAIGLFAGLSIAIKPQFLFTPVLIEIFYICHKRNWLAFLRAETAALAGWLIIYMMLALRFHQDYLFVVVPYMMDLYYKSISSPWSYLLLNDVVFFCLFVLLVYFIQRKENTYKMLSTVLFISLIGFLLSYFAQHTFFYYHVIPAFSFALLLLILLFGLFLDKNRHLFTIILGIIVFSFPVYICSQIYNYGLTYKKNTLDNLIAFMRTQPPHQSIYILSEANYSSPLIDYTNTTISQRYDCLWMVEHLVKLKQSQGEKAVRQYLRNNNSKYFFLNVIADDLHRHQPDLIFVDIKKTNVWLSHHYTHFDYLNYFMENEKFQNEWKSYRYLTTITSGDQYKLQIYKRVT